MKSIAIVGYGGQGAWHARCAESSDVISLAGVYDTNENRNNAARMAGIRVYTTLDELLSDAEVDVVVCATPNDSHLEIVLRALEAGKHVVCEKPVALSVSDFDRMCECAKKNNRIFTVHQNRRWDVDYLAIRSLVESGEIGEIINIESRIHGSRGIPSDWRRKKTQGGGMVLDWGVHLIDQILTLIPDKITSVFAKTTNVTSEEVDDGFTLFIEFDSGKRATVEVGTYNFLPLPRFYMQATNGTAYIEDWQKACRVARLKAWCEKDVLPVQNAAGITKTMAPRDEVTLDVYEIPRPASDVHDFYRNLSLAIDGKCELAVKAHEVRRVLSVMQAIFESSEEGKVVKM